MYSYNRQQINDKKSSKICIKHSDDKLATKIKQDLHNTNKLTARNE